LVAAQGAVVPDSDTLYDFLKRSLPEYMVPNRFVVLEQLPLTRNGKLDDERLPAPELPAPDAQEYAEPRVPTERVLAKIWADVLKLERVGIHDNFFELGGMSMTALRVTDLAAQAGLTFMPTDLFEFQTIAELAAQLSIGPGQNAEAASLEGEVPLMPIQRMFMLQTPHLVDQFAIFSQYEVAQPVQSAFLRKAVQYVAAHHDALAIQLISQEKLILRLLPAVQLQYDKCFAEIDLSHLDASQEPSAFLEIGSTARRRIIEGKPPLLYTVLINRGPGKPQQFLLVAHHFVTDNWSMQVLLEDIETVYGQLAAGQSPLLPRKTTPFKVWAERLATFAHSREFKTDVAMWRAEQWNDYGVVPFDYPEREYELGSDETLSLKLENIEADPLLEGILREQRAQSTEVFLAVLAETLLQWTGKPKVAIDLFSSGRATYFPGLNVARTVGWFSTPVPVLLERNSAANMSDMLRQVKQRVRALPSEGIAYGVGKFLLEDGNALVAMPQVCLNNLGGLSQPDSLFRMSPHQFYDDPHPGHFKRHHLIDLVITAGTRALGMHWIFSRSLHRRETIAKLGENYIANLRSMAGRKNIGA
jgi:non-ribosomal peptide synthase protein (TIGR01720 family)